MITEERLSNQRIYDLIDIVIEKIPNQYLEQIRLLRRIQVEMEERKADKDTDNGKETR